MQSFNKISAITIICSTLAAAGEQMKINPRGWRAAMEAEGALGGHRASQTSSLHAADAMSCSSSPPPLFFLFGPYTTWCIGFLAFALGLVVGYIWNQLYTKTQLKLQPRINGNRLKATPPPEKVKPPPTTPLEETYEIVEKIESSCDTSSGKRNNNAGTISTATTTSENVAGLSSLGALENTTTEDTEIETTAGATHGGGSGASVGELATDSSDAIVIAVAHKLSSLDFNRMSTKEQLLALELMLKVDHTQNAKRLGAEANKIQSERLGVAKHTAAHILAKDAVALARERTEEFKKTCSDSMATGVLLMAVVGGYQGYRRGFFTPLFYRCGSLPRVSSWGPLGLWGAYKSAEVAFCYSSGISDTLLGIFVLIFVPWVVYRTGLLHDYHKMPIAKIFIGLGLVCGAAGHVAISKVGGDGWTWFILWQFWTVVHVILSTTAFRMCQRDVAAALQQIGAQGTAASAENIFRLHTGDLAVGGDRGGSNTVQWIAAGLWMLSGIVLPALMATVPFVS
jgi:hypothetical protein